MVITPDSIKDILSTIPDPEIPAITIVELGIVRKVEVENGKVTVSITPTYSGCPAMEMIESQIVETLQAEGIKNVYIKTVLHPTWTTDWISEEAKAKLEAYGIAPPKKLSHEPPALFCEQHQTVTCPFCKSEDTTLTSIFGSTACKALHYCNSCEQPFERFKCI